MNVLHSDYNIACKEVPPGERPISIIVGLDEFMFMFLQKLSDERKDIANMIVLPGQMIKFTAGCLHAGGTNDTNDDKFRLFAYMVSRPHHIQNEVTYFDWTDPRSMNAVILPAHLTHLNQEEQEEKPNRTTRGTEKRATKKTEHYGFEEWKYIFDKNLIWVMQMNDTILDKVGLDSALFLR
jgi:hypothetical protein